MRMEQARRDGRGVGRVLCGPGHDRRSRGALRHTHPDGTLKHFLLVWLRHGGGTEAKAGRADQEREHSTHRGRRPFGCHAHLIGTKRKTPV
jgi:hypothetical protein